VRRPPRLATRFLDLVVPARDRDVLVGDLVEEHALLALTARRGGAACWYWSQALRTAASVLWAGARRGQRLKTLGAVLAGYLAARLRRRAAGALAVLAAVMGVVSLLATGPAAPIWYQLALIVVGPAGALLGGHIRARRMWPSLRERG